LGAQFTQAWLWLVLCCSTLLCEVEHSFVTLMGSWSHSSLCLALCGPANRGTHTKDSIQTLFKALVSVCIQQQLHKDATRIQSSKRLCIHGCCTAHLHRNGPKYGYSCGT